MKHAANIFMIVLLLIITNCNKQGQSNSDSHIQEREALPTLTIEEVQTAVEAFNQVMINPDVKVLEAFCSNELTYGHSSGLIQNKSEFVNDLVNGPYNFTSVTSPELTISISENIGVARFIFLATAIKDNQQIDIRIGCVQIFQRDNNNKLKLLARQAFKLPKPANN